MKNVLIVNVDKRANEANSLLKEIYKDEILLDLNDTVSQRSKNYSSLNDLFKPEYAQEIEEVTVEFMVSWYKMFKKDLTYSGICLPELTETEWLKTWPIFLKIKILNNFLNKEKPNKIYLITEYEEDIKILQEFLKNKKIEFEYKLFSYSEIKKNNINLKEISRNFMADFQNALFNVGIKENNDKRNILFIGNVRQGGSLLSLLASNPENNIIRCGEDVGKGIFSKYGNYYLTFKRRYKNTLKNKIEKERIELNKKYEEIVSNKKFRDSLYYIIPLFEIMQPRIKKMFLKNFPKLIRYIEVMRNIKDKIDIVVSLNDSIEFERTIIESAKLFKIPNMTLSLYLPVNYIKEGTVMIPKHADKVIIHSKSQIKPLMNKGISKDKLFVGGHPYFDIYFNKDFTSREEMLKRYNIPQDKKIILYVGERYLTDRYESSVWSAFTKDPYNLVYKEIFESVKQIPNSFLIMKKHPSGSLDEEMINNAANEVGFKNYVIVSDLDVHNIINISDVVIARLSTMMLEAMLLKKPVILMDTYFHSNDMFGYTKFNAALHARKPGDLKRLLKSAYDKKVLKKLNGNMDRLLEYNYPSKGDSSEKIANLIESSSKSR